MMNFVETILDECCFISGGRKSGKTNLGILLVDKLLNNGVQVKVIDSSRQWLKRSSVPNYLKVASARKKMFTADDYSNERVCFGNDAK